MSGTNAVSWSIQSSRSFIQPEKIWITGSYYFWQRNIKLFTQRTKEMICCFTLILVFVTSRPDIRRYWIKTKGLTTSCQGEKKKSEKRRIPVPRPPLRCDRWYPPFCSAGGTERWKMDKYMLKDIRFYQSTWKTVKQHYNLIMTESEEIVAMREH